MPISISDVAKKAGVSGATVSKVLNNADGARISGKTRQEVMRVARDLGYTPNAIARSLRTQRTNIIGLYCGYGYVDVSSPYVAAMVDGLQDQCGILRKDLLLHGGFRIDTAEEVYNELANGRISALVLNSPPNDRLVELLAASSLPAVVIGDTVENLPSVVVDNVSGVRLLAEHLAQKGHRRIMYRKGKWFSTSRTLCLRLAVFHKAAAEYGMTVHEVTETDNGRALSEEEAELLSSPAGLRPTAIVCWHDPSAYGFLKLSKSLGLRIPEDLAVAGFNGIETEMPTLRDLTTIRAPWSDVGRTAILLLAELLSGKEVAPVTMLPVELLVGDTT